MPEEKTVKSCFTLPISQHKAVRRYCVDAERAVQDVFAEAMLEWIERHLDKGDAK